MMDNLPETTPVIEKPSPKRRRWWPWVVLLIILGLAGGAFAVRQIETRHWEAGQAAIAAGEWETAVTEFNSIVYLWPPFLRQHTAEATALRGVAYFQQGKQLAALPDFDAALTLDPNQIDIIAFRSVIHYESGAWELAQADMEAALAQAALLPDHLLAQLNANLALLPPEMVADGDRETAVAAALDLSRYLPEETAAELYTRQAEYAFAAPEAADGLAAIDQALTLEASLTRAQEARLLPAKAQLLAESSRWPDALVVIEEALRLRSFLDEPTQAALYSLRGQIYFEQGDWETAVAEAEAALALDDSLAWPDAALAWQAYRTADYEAAQTQAEAALAKDETIALAYTVQGALLTWQGKVHEALEMLEMALTHNPEDVEALALQAYNLREINATEELIAAVETAVAAQPEAPATLWARAIGAAENQEWSLTFALMNQAIALDDDRAEFYFYRAPYYPLEGDWEKAEADLEASLELNPEFAPAVVALAFTRGDRYDYTDLATIQQEVLEKWPDWYVAHQLSGYYYEEVVGDNDLALAAYNKAIERLPERPRVYLPRAFLYVTLAEYDKAQTDFETVLALNDQVGAAYYGLASVAGARDDVDLQGDFLRQAVEITDNGRSARLDLGYYFITTEAYEQAWQLANELIAEDETDAAAYLIRAIVHTAEGNNRQALIELDQVLELNPYLMLAYFVKSEALLASERYVEAARTVQQIWEYEPDAYEVHQQLFFIAISEDDLAEAERQYLLWLSAKPDYAENYPLQANMELLLGHFEDAAATFTAALAENDEAEELLFGRAIAYLSLEDDTNYQADFEQLLEVGTSIEIISDAEYWLAVDDGLLVSVDGLATYTDESLGYQMSYPAEWERVVLGPEDDVAFAAFLDSPEGFASINLVIIEGAFGLTLNDVAAIVRDNLNQRNDFVMLSSEFGEVGGVPAFIHEYELTVQDGLGRDELLLGRQYILLRGSTVWFFTIEASEANFASNMSTFAEIIDSIEFVP